MEEFANLWKFVWTRPDLSFAVLTFAVICGLVFQKDGGPGGGNDCGGGDD